jgi:hypothetical protein
LLFSLFISLLADITTSFTYADDNYLLGSGKTEKKALENCIKETKIAMKWFLNSGICVNKKKTEVCVFHRNNSRACKIFLGSEKVSVLKNMKILGLIFDSKLNWYHQTAFEEANKAQQGLIIISKYFSPQKMVKLSMALFYSRLYYEAKIWLSSALSATLKKKLWQTSSKMLKICQKTGKDSILSKCFTKYPREQLRNVVKLQRSM